MSVSVNNSGGGSSGVTNLDAFVTIADEQTVIGAKTFSSPVTVNNDITATGTITGSKVYNAVWNDYAEWFEKGNLNETLEPGDICVWDGNGVTKCSTPNDSSVIGVYSDSYGHILGGEELTNMEDNKKKFAPIGLKGRVKCKVVGETKIGDLIVTYKDGIGIVDNNAQLNQIVGKCLENNSDINAKKVLILV